MTENLKKFLETVSEDAELSKKIGNMGKADILALAKKLGMELSEADFAQNEELNEDELDAVVGGYGCYCLGAGNGEKSRSDKLCFCVAGGGGEKRNGDCRCWCVVMGTGLSDDKS